MSLSDLYNTQGLIDNIKRRCSVPTSQLTYTPEDFALLATDELQGEVVPLLMSCREEYFVDFYDTPIPSDGIFEFPDDTVASKVRSVCYVTQYNPLVLVNLPRIDLDVVAGVGWTNYRTLRGFYLQGNSLVLYPNNPAPSGISLRIYYYKRNLVLAAPGQYGKVLAVDEMNTSVQLSLVPAEWDTGTVLNSVKGNTPFGTTNEALTIVSVSSPTIVLDTVEGISVGDYISDQGYSAVPQIPLEAHAYLAQLVAAKCLEGLGDREGTKIALEKAMFLKKALLIMLTQRVDGSTKKIINPNGGLRLGAGLGRWGSGWGR